MTEDNFQINSAAITDRGLSEKRPQNEDSYLEMQQLGLFAVADGVGGAQAGDVASQMAMEILGEAFMHLRVNGDAEEMMRVAIERANSAIYQMSSDLPQLSTMATTIVALHVNGNIATIGHVGDSRLYRLDGRGNLYRETQDHSVVEEEVRAGRMTAAQAANHPSRNVISRALGAESGVQVDMKTIMFDGNTKFLLCSDGITRHITDFEIRELLSASASPAEICGKMKEICYSRGAEDNLTAVIVNAFSHSAQSQTPSFAAAPPIDEEATVATARAAQSEPPPATAESFDADEIPTRALEMPASMSTPAPASDASAASSNAVYAADDDESYLMEEPLPEPAPAASTVSSLPNTMTFRANPEAAETQAETPKPVEEPKSFQVYETREQTSSGGGLLTSLVWLVVGALIGAGGFYFYQTMTAKTPEAPAITQMQSSNPSYTAFENLKREIDKDPKKYITTAEKSPPKDAADFYLLGRAYLLQGNYDSAKTSFIEARNKLPEYSEAANKDVLTSDINAFLVIAQDRAAQTSFERERNLSKPVEQPNANQ